MTDRNDILIIGGGHNGLVCAAYLAKAGRHVQVLEAASQVGGAAITREFAPGFRVSACAHLLNVLDARISRELELERHGSALTATGLATVALAEQGEHLTIDAAGARGGGISAADAEAYTAFHARLARFAALLQRLYGRRAPRLKMDGMADAMELGRTALDIRRLSRDDMRELLRIAAINVYDILEEQFDRRSTASSGPASDRARTTPCSISCTGAVARSVAQPDRSHCRAAAWGVSATRSRPRRRPGARPYAPTPRCGASSSTTGRSVAWSWRAASRSVHRPSCPTPIRRRRC
jgi:phytoene dehydrogenase-like protein